MKRLMGILFLMVATPAMASNVNIDYAKEFDFSKVKTYRYVSTDETNALDPMMAERIVQDLKAQLAAAGLKEVEEGEDVSVTYHLTTKTDQVLSTTSFGYGGFAAGWGAWGGLAANTTTTEMTYTEGTLVVDAYQADSKHMIFRSTGTITVAKKPEKQVEQLSNLIEKMSEKWHRIMRNEGK